MAFRERFSYRETLKKPFNKVRRYIAPVVFSAGMLFPHSIHAPYQNSQAEMRATYSSTISLDSLQRPEVPNAQIEDERLADYNITIYNTPSVKLHLRESALELPLFADAKSGALKNVSIVLVDAENLSPENIKNLPEEAQFLYNETFKISNARNEETLASLSHVQSEITLREQQHAIGIITDDEYATYLEYLQTLEKSLIQKKDNFERIYYKSRGLYVNGNLHTYSNNEAAKNKVTIYLAAGGNRKPYPVNSYPSPDKYPLTDPTPGDSYRVLTRYRTTEYALEHEASHHAHPTEGAADFDAVTRIANGIFSFVFETDEGEIVTKNHENSETHSLSL